MTDPRTLQRGCQGEDVEAWQRFLHANVDGDFGEETERLTIAWQKDQGLRADGVVGPLSQEAAARHTPTVRPPQPPTSSQPIAFIPARFFDRSRYGSPITVIVIHTAETPEGPKTARSVASWFASLMLGADGKSHPASAHYSVDANEIVQSVRDSEMAYGAPYANRNGLHIEHAGRASQTAEQWADAYSEAMLQRSADLVANLCRKNGIPCKRLDPEDLKAGARGICGHDTVSKAFPVAGGHMDPGPAFPWAAYIELVMQADNMGGKPHVS